MADQPARTQLGEHTFTGLAGEKVTLTAWSNGKPGMRLTPVVNVRIDFVDGYTEMEVPAVSCPAFAEVFRLAWEARNVSA